jgi:hypothetical protein
VGRRTLHLALGLAVGAAVGLTILQSLLLRADQVME